MTTRTFAPGDMDLPIVDAHHHFFLLQEGRSYPWLQEEYDDSFFLGSYRSMCRFFGVEEYRRAVAGFDVVADVHVEAERSRNEQVAETVDLSALHAETSSPSVIVGHVGFTQPDRDVVLAAHAKHPLVRGIRSKPIISKGPQDSVAGRAGTLQDPRWQEGLAALAQHHFSWDLRVPFWHLSEAAEVVSEHPEVPVVLNHAGLPLDRSPAGLAMWRTGMEKLAALPHVTVKVSELGLRDGRWDAESNQLVVRETVKMFGFERSMFASNLPVCSLSTSFAEVVLTILRALPRASDAELRALFAGTATAAYRMPSRRA